MSHCRQNKTFIFLACWEYKTHTQNFFYWLHFFFTWLFLYHKKVTWVLSSTSNFAWQFCYQWNQQCTILPQTQYANFVEQNSILTLSYRTTRSWSLCCLVPVRHFPSPYQSIHFGDVSEVNRREMKRPHVFAWTTWPKTLWRHGIIRPRD